MRLSKPGIIILEVIGVAIAILVAFVAFAFWRLQSGPVSLSFLKPSAEFAIERMAPGPQDVQIGHASIVRNRRRGGYDLVLKDVSVYGTDENLVAQLANIEANFSPLDVVRGNLAPRHIISTESVLRFVRKRDSSIELGYGEWSKHSTNNLFNILTGRNFFRSAIETVEFKKARVEFFDEASGSAWTAKDSSAAIIRAGDKFHARVIGSFLIEGKKASLSLDAEYSEISGEINADLKVSDAPVGDILEMFFGPPANFLNAPITGNASLRLTSGGQVISSEIVGQAGRGRLKIGDIEAILDHVDFAIQFDPEKNQFSIDRLSYAGEIGSGEINGGVGLRSSGDDRALQEVTFDVVAKNVELILPAWLPEPLLIEAFHSAGDYHLASRRLSLEAINAKVVDVEIAGAAAIEIPRVAKNRQQISPAITADLMVDGQLSPQRILKLWPITFGLGARDFVEERIPTAIAKNVSLVMDLKAGAISDLSHMPDDAMTLSFDIENATTIYAPGMTPLTGVSGAATLNGNSFTVLDARGNVGNIPLTGGKVDMPALSPKGQLSYFSFSARGAARDILGVLDQRPLAILQHTNLSPEQFSGDGEMRVRISRPNRVEVPRRKYGYSGSAKFSDLSIDGFYGDIVLTRAVGGVELSTESMTITADAELGGTPIKLNWLQRFYGDGDKTRIQVSGVVDSATGDVMGIQTRQLLRGPVAFDANATGNIGEFKHLSVNADFEKAAVTLNLLGWHKPQDLPALGRLEVDLLSSGAHISLVEIVGNGVLVRGSAQLGGNGRIDDAQFEQFVFDGAADLSVSAKRSPAGELDLTLTGEYLNIGPVLERFFNSVGDAGQEPAVRFERGMRIVSRINRLGLRDGEAFTDASFDLRRNSERLQALDFSAIADSGEPVSMSLKLTGDDTGPSQIVEARTDDIGSLLRGFFGLQSVSGGQGVLEILITPGDRASKSGRRTLGGTLEARNIRVRGASLLARIFAAGSLQGLSNLLNGEGIELSSAFADFSFDNGTFSLRDGYAAGPSVGLSATGEVVLGEAGGISLNGAVAPAYQVNSLLGKAPLVGDIFVNREGEGVVALAYEVSGPVSAPTVTINPFSAFAPGVLRRIFEPNRATGAQEMEKTPESVE